MPRSRRATPIRQQGNGSCATRHEERSPMDSSDIPVKTPDGHAELSTRQRRLSQRHRTLLLLVDGRRSQAQVLALAGQAGVPAACFDELLALGLVVLTQPVVTLPREATPSGAMPLRVDLPLDPGDTPLPAGDSVLPASPALAVDSTVSGALQSVTPSGADWVDVAHADELADEDPFEEARAMLLRAVRAEAPVAGSLTLLRLRRAQTRAELSGLLAEVEARISKPHRQLAAAQTLRRVRYLLGLRADSGISPV
jgi:hypothetical protein